MAGQPSGRPKSSTPSWAPLDRAPAPHCRQTEPPKERRYHSIPASRIRKPNPVSRRGEEPAHAAVSWLGKNTLTPAGAPQTKPLLSTSSCTKCYSPSDKRSEEKKPVLPRAPLHDKRSLRSEKRQPERSPPGHNERKPALSTAKQTKQ
ncbi:hypothetical protein JEQ12_004022 [Ovis aries]|uniref:Uncharacterized protein n=1 Tax=Ovis aries TaxID=9940 RepID=A0A836A7N1_SHEEP|nr:hypothetical protein JEQ12_004022 [Ovis aries]